MAYQVGLLAALVISAAVVAVFRGERLLHHFVNPWLRKHATLLGAYRSLLAFLGFPALAVGGLLAYQNLAASLARPDVVLEFTGLHTPAIRVRNVSSAVVHQPKYTPILFNVDRPADERLNPLRIPTATGDFIRPRRAWGPNTFIGLDRAGVKDGDRILGAVTATCPDCIADRTYWFYVHLGKSGWYAEMDGFNVYALARLLDKPNTVVEAFHRTVLKDQRLPIEAGQAVRDQ